MKNLRLWAWGVALACTSLFAEVASAADRTLTLERAIALAIENNERAKIAGDRARAAEARVDKARAFFFPDLTLRGTYTRRAFETVREGIIIQSHNALSAVASLQLTVFDARAFPLYRRAKLQAEAESLVAGDTVRRIAFEAAEAYLTTLSLAALRDAAAHRLEFSRTALEDARARFRAALVSSNDVTRPELELATAERELTRARAEVESAELQLAYLIGASDRVSLQPPGTSFGVLTGTTAGAKTMLTGAEARRLDLAARRALTQAAEEAASEPLLRLLPTLALNGEVRATNETGFSQRDIDGFVSLNLVWPIFDGGERYADRDEQLALARIAALEERAEARRVGLDVELALVHIGSSGAAREQSVIALDIARRNARETVELYREGLASALEVSDANLRLFEAEVNKAREEYGLLLSHLELRSALGLDPLGKEWPR